MILHGGCEVVGQPMVGRNSEAIGIENLQGEGRSPLMYIFRIGFGDFVPGLINRVYCIRVILSKGVMVSMWTGTLYNLNVKYSKYLPLS